MTREERKKERESERERERGVTVVLTIERKARLYAHPNRRKGSGHRERGRHTFIISILAISGRSAMHVKAAFPIVR